MNKSTFFSGQPIFTQLLRFIPRDTVLRIARETGADHYYRRFKTYEHLVTMLYSIFNNCNSLREVTTGMLASEQRLFHLGVRYYPRRSTISDANTHRPAEVFEQLYQSLYRKYPHFLSDSRPASKASRLYIIDSTTISLFHDILQAGGERPANGKSKGGVKVHTLIRSDQDVPSMIRLTSGVANDSQFLKEVNLPKGSVIVFDRGYYDYTTFKRFTNERVTWVTRVRKLFAYDIVGDIKQSGDSSIKSDQQIVLGPRSKTQVSARLIRFFDNDSGIQYEFITNNFRMSALTIASIYKKRWQIESLFKRLKQSYPLKYFLGDSVNAIKIQIWCALIADLLLKIVKKGTTARWSFSNLAAMVRLHLMTYIDLFGFLKSPEKALLKTYTTSYKEHNSPLLFAT